RQHVIADRYFVIDLAGHQPLVDALVTPGQQNQTFLPSELHHQMVIQQSTLRREVDHLGLFHSATALTLSRRFQRFLERLGHHHHARATAVRPVIYRPVSIGAEVARIPQHQLIQPALERPSRHPRAGDGVEHLRKQGDRIKMDQKSVPQSTVSRPPAASTSTTTASTKGMSRSRSPPTTNTGFAPVSRSPVTCPNAAPSRLT